MAKKAIRRILLFLSHEPGQARALVKFDGGGNAALSTAAT